MKTLNIKLAAAVLGLTAGLVMAVPVTASADATTTTTTNPSVTGPPVQGTTVNHVTMYVDTVNAALGKTVPAGAVNGACAVTHTFVQGQTVVFRMWGTAADGTPLTGPNSQNSGNVQSASVTIQTSGGGSTTVPMAYATHGGGSSYWTAAWPTTTSTATGAVNYTVTVQTYKVPAVYKNGHKTVYRLAYKKVNGHRKAYLKRVRKHVKILVTAGIPGQTGTFSSSQLSGLPGSALTIDAQGTAPTWQT